MKIKIAHISDTHGHLPPNPKLVDILIHTGDHTHCNKGDLECEVKQMKALNKRFGEMKEPYSYGYIDVREIIYVPGNHDFLPIKTLKNILTNVDVVVDSDNPYFELKGVKFFGTSYQKDYGT